MAAHNRNQEVVNLRPPKAELAACWADISCPEAILRVRRHLDRDNLSIGLELHTTTEIETVHQRCPPSLEQLFSGNVVQKQRNK